MTFKQRGNMRAVVSVEPTEDPENGAPREKITLECDHVVIRASRVYVGFKHIRAYCPDCGLPPETPTDGE